MFALYGQEAYRRFERRALERVLAHDERAVIATGGSLVTDAGTYRSAARALPLRLAESIARGAHGARRRAGRPAAVQGNATGRPSALDEIRQLLADRDRLYSRADVTLDTSGKTLRASLSQLSLW